MAAKRIALEWNGSRLRRCRMMSSPGSKSISRPFGRRSLPVSVTPVTSGSAAAGSTVSGTSPISPSTTAFTLPCPCPVAPSEPNSSTRSSATRSATPSATSEPANMPAARIGPTVWELDGPIPILNSSKALMVTSYLPLWWRSATDTEARRVVGGAQVDGRPADGAADVDMVGTLAQVGGRDHVAVVVPHVGQPHRRAEGLPPGARHDLAHRHAVAQHQFAAPHHFLCLVQDQRNEPAPRALRPRFLDRLAAKEADVGAELAREQQARLDRVVVRGQLSPEGPVPLLEPHRLDGVIPGVDQAERSAGS